jgi:phage repressor protein C with HTH and peptisase S24 domain
MSIHFGDWLAQEIARLGVNQSEFSRRANIPLPTLRTWLKLPRSEIRGGNLEKLSQALGKPQDEIKTKLRQAYYVRGDQSMSVPIMNRPGERLVMRPVPIINAISASRFVEKTNLDYPPGFADRYVPAPTDDPEAFAMIVDGDCMEPDYRRGELVIFSPLEVQRYGPQTGKDYAIQLDGQSANESSFKRLFTDKENPGIFYFRCANPKYKTNEKVQRDRVLRLARAIWVSRPPPKPDLKG